MKKIISGIYAIKNKINDKIYIGSSNNIGHRWNTHLSQLSNDKHHNDHLQNSWNYYGGEFFDFTIQEECSVDLLDFKEEFWIEFYKSWNQEFGYNISRYVDGRTIFSEETKLKMKRCHLNFGDDYFEFKNKIIELNSQNISKKQIATIVKANECSVYKILTDEGLYKKRQIKIINGDDRQKIILLRNQDKKWYDIAREIGVCFETLQKHGFTQDGYACNRKNEGKVLFLKNIPELELKLDVLREENKTWEQISKELNVGHAALLNSGLTKKYPKINSPKIKFSIEEENKMVDLHLENYSNKEIAKIMNRKESVIHSYINKRYKKGDKHKSFNILTDAIESQIIELRLSGKSFNEISQLLNLKMGMVGRCLRNAGIQNVKNHKTTTKITPAILDQIIKLKASGKNFTEIGFIFSIDQSTIRKKWNKVNNIKKGKNLSIQRKENIEIAKSLKFQGKSNKEICQIMNKNIETVKKYLS